MKIKRKILIIFGFFMLLAVTAYFFIVNSGKFHLFQGAQAVGGYPYQIGLTGVTITSCATTGYPPVCAGGTLCYVKDPLTCAFYVDVIGMPAGGMGIKALFSNTSILIAGLAQGGQLIAGGMGPVLMDNGVLASSGGCYGCLAKVNKIDKIKQVFDYVIASFK